MVREHHQLNGRVFEQTLGDGWRTLVGYSPCRVAESDTTEAT